MKIEIRTVNPFVDVKIVEGQTTIDMGLMNAKERAELAKTLLSAAYELGPTDYYQCRDWFIGLAKEIGIHDLTAKSS